MLFYPQGYQKPLRVQGPFVSDSEVEAVVDFLKKQSTVVYNEEIEEKMNTVSISSGGSGALGGNEPYPVSFWNPRRKIRKMQSSRAYSP